MLLTVVVSSTTQGTRGDLVYWLLVYWLLSGNRDEPGNPFRTLPATIEMNGHFDSLSDEALARKACAGDRAAFDTLCERCLPAVYNRLRVLLPPEAVEDVTQEVFIAAMHSIRRYRGSALFRTWISGIARHKVADYYRQRGRQPETTPLDLETNDPAAPGAWEERALVRIALQQLPEHYQEILLLRFTEGLPFEQIAGTLDISLEAAKSRYRRAVAAIAEEMQEVG